MGVVAALKELVDDIEEVLSARARGAIGGGLEECMGGLKGLGTSPTPGFPGGSFGRDGGRGGGGGGVALPQGTKGVAGRAGDDAPGKQAGVKKGWKHKWPKRCHHTIPIPHSQSTTPSRTVCSPQQVVYLTL